MNTVFFDLDDTLMDHTAAMRAGATALHAKASLDIPIEAFLGKWQVAIDRHYPRFVNGEITYETARRTRIRETIDSGLSDAAADCLFETYLADYESAWTLFPDALPCLDRCSSLRLGIITNGRSAEQRRKLARFDLTVRFDHVLISEECGCAKPTRQIFQQACDAAGVAPAQALYIGDHYELDACGARSAGLNGIWLDRRGQASPNHHPPMIHSLDEASAYIPEP